MAIDKGTPPLTGTTQLVVNILDVNNKPPEFLPPSRVASVSEGARIGFQFYDFVAVDPDETAMLRYSVLDEISGQDENGVDYPDKAYLRVSIWKRLTSGLVSG